MIRAKTATTVRVMFTTFRDGLQSTFGGKVRLDDFLPAVQASLDAGIRHFEFGGGARYPRRGVGVDPPRATRGSAAVRSRSPRLGVRRLGESFDH